MGGFPHYGRVRNEYVILKGSTPGPSRRPLTLRKPLYINTTRSAAEKITLKFIDTSAKFGHGRFQTTKEKHKFMGATKRVALAGGDKEEKKE